MTESDMTESADPVAHPPDMTGSARPGALTLRMPVAGYEVKYTRGSFGTGTEHHVDSSAQILMSVNSVTVEHFNKPIKRVILNFSEGPFEQDHVGFMVDGGGWGLLVTVEARSADVAAVWAALRLDRVATLECTIDRGGKVFGLEVSSQGSLFPLFGV